jgi:hypothetical protein
MENPCGYTWEDRFHAQPGRVRAFARTKAFQEPSFIEITLIPVMSPRSGTGCMSGWRKA